MAHNHYHTCNDFEKELIQMSRRIFWLINVQLLGNNINKVKKIKRKTMSKKGNKLNPFGIAAIMDIGHILFVIISVWESLLFKNKGLKCVVLSLSWLAATLSEIVHVSITVVLSNDS